MHRQLVAALLFLGVAGAASAQTNCVETLFAGNNQGSVGGGIYFDLTVTQNVSISGMEVNTTNLFGDVVGLSVYTAPMTAVGNETNMAAWTLVAEDDGSTLSAGVEMMTPIVFVAPFNLAPGSYGIALVGDNMTTGAQMAHRYTNGTGANQAHVSGDGVLSLALGTATNQPFTGGIFSPRVWNGKFCHGVGSGPGTNYCMANVNSTGGSAVMAASGSAVVTLNDLVLEANDMPNNSFAFFLTSMTQGFTANPGGSEGNLCLGGAIGRFVGAGQIQNSGGSGAVSLAIDNASQPTPTGLVQIQAGDTWNFTCWFRDLNMMGATSNFADGLEITFL